MKYTHRVTLKIDILATVAGSRGPIRLRAGTEGYSDGIPIGTLDLKHVVEFHIPYDDERGQGADVYFVPKVWVRLSGPPTTVEAA